MSNKANSSTQKSDYLPGAPSRAPLTHEEFCDIIRPFWMQQKQLQRTGDCNRVFPPLGNNSSLNFSFQIKLEGKLQAKEPEPWKQNKEVDPKFPWRSYRNERGEIVYCIPMEYQNEIPGDNSEDARKYRYSTLPLFGGKYMKVYWEETTCRKWAYDQKRWIDAEAKRNERQWKREIPVDEILGDGTPDDGNRKTDRSQQKQKENTDQDSPKPIIQKSYTGPSREPLVEPFVLNKIEKEELKAKMEAKDPRLWLVFSKKNYEGVDVKTLMKELKLSQARIYQLINDGKKVLAEHRVEE